MWLLPRNINTGKPLFTEGKIKDFSMTFHDLFKQIQDLLHQLKPERFTLYFQKNYIIRLYPGWSWKRKTANDRSLWTKLRPCEVTVFVLQHCRIKVIFINNTFILFLAIKKYFFAYSRIFKDHGNPVNSLATERFLQFSVTSLVHFAQMLYSSTASAVWESFNGENMSTTLNSFKWTIYELTFEMETYCVKQRHVLDQVQDLTNRKHF